MNQIKTEFGKKLDLRFVDGTPSNLKELSRTADKVLGMTRFMKHKTEENIVDTANYQRLSGGLSTLRDHLKEIAR